MQPQQRIGLLGGSFNPAHAGHVHISLEAKKRLGLDKIVWLVSPQNPLKTSQNMAPYEQRVIFAKQLTESIQGIDVSTIEQEKQLYYSCDTIAHILQHYPQAHFVWLIGADNWQYFHRWRRWQWIAEHIPIAICDRSPFSHQALQSKAAIRYRQSRMSGNTGFALQQAPAWQFLFLPRHPLSATHLRKTLGEDAFFMA